MRMGYDLSLSERVEELLGDETFGEVLRMIEDDLRDEIFRTADEAQRTQVYHEMHALNRINLKLQTIVDCIKMERR